METESTQEKISKLLKGEIAKVKEAISEKQNELKKLEFLLKQNNSVPSITKYGQDLKALFDANPKLEITTIQVTDILAKKYQYENRKDIQANINTILYNYVRRNVLKKTRLKSNHAWTYSINKGWGIRGIKDGKMKKKK